MAWGGGGQGGGSGLMKSWGWGRVGRGRAAQAFFSWRIWSSSSASSVVFTLMSMGTGVLAFLSSTGGLGTHTTITLFFPILEQGMEACTMMFSRMFPVDKGEKLVVIEGSLTHKHKSS